jgi:hypothetical protein
MDELSSQLAKLHWRLEGLSRTGPPGTVLVCALFVALVMVLMLLPDAIVGTQGRRTPAKRLLALATGCLVATFGACAWPIAMARTRALDTLFFGPRHSETASAYFSHWDATHLTAFFALFAIPILLVVALRVFPRATTRAFVVMASALGMTTAYGALALADANQLVSNQGCGDPEALSLWTRRNLADAQRLVSLYIRALVAVGIAGVAICAKLASRDARRGRVVSRRTLCGSALLFALGAGVFLATGATAADTHRQIPHRPLPSRCPPETVDIAPTHGSPCDALVEGPIIVFRDGAFSIDGSDALSHSAVMNVLRNKANLWKQINPGKAFPGTALAVAPAGTPVRALPFGRLHELGFRRIQLVTRADPARVETATLGVFELHPLCCGTALELDPAAPPLPPHATYEDLLQAAQHAKHSNRVLRIAPFNP